MKGDFSQWYFNRKDNFAGVLHQQGRVLLDSDWNAQTQIINDWQDTAGQDIIGAGVAAVPAETPNAFKVVQAKKIDGDRVQITLLPGRIWADGMLVHLNEISQIYRIATYLQSSIQNSPTIPIANSRDAVILEVWRESINGFQMPETLIEPALGGPDTTERVLTSMRFRLLRLAVDEDCHNIIDKLKDDVGKLKVSLQDLTATGGDCPVVEGGGYTGFEHQLYRIEIAQVKGDVPMFKWSQFNGGLVGRGEFKLEGTNKRIQLTANDQAIKMSGLTDFYLEVVKLDEEQGFWRVTYGAEVTLNDDDLAVSNERYVESDLPSGKVFFRLWNGISAIVSFPKATAPAEPKELRDGIRLEFDNPNTTYYRSGDYWTFKVRAGEISNPPILLEDQHPQGINYHRVPLAELNWDENLEKGISFDEGKIEDCRDVFRPLTKQKGCCTFSVGDGKISHGDFDAIEQALRHLPKSGGKICLLPGLHEANVIITGKRNIKIEGCGKHTRVIPRKETRQSPIFRIIDSECIALLDMDLVTLGGTAILLEATEVGNLKEIEIGHNRIIACKEAIHVKRGIDIHIHDNKIRMLDKAMAGVAMYLITEDSLVERNDIGVIPAEKTPRPERPDGGGETPNPTDPCADLEIVYSSIPAFVAYINLIWQIPLFFIPTNPFKALGGIQIAGGSERVKVWENTINGGAGNGIALGTSLAAFLEELEESPEEDEQSIEHEGGDLWGRVASGERGLKGISLVFESKDRKTFSTQTDDGDYFIIREVPAGEYSVTIATPGYKIKDITARDEVEFGISQNISIVEEEIDFAELLAFIYDIEIDRNEISHMGLSGIGIPRVELPDSLPRTVARKLGIFVRFLALFGNPIIGLGIHENHIFNCFQNPINETLRTQTNVRGFGGISLGICANLAIDRNRIESNGTSHINPVCGIFVTYGEQMDINHNSMAENGALTNATSALIPGRRGGIVIGASSFPLLSLLSTSLSATKSMVGVANTSALLGRPAARVHDNIVNQPAGQALTIFAIGPVSVVSNYFNSELSGIEFFDRLAGAVLIVNLGGLNRLGTPGIGGINASPGAFSGAENINSFVAPQNSQPNLLFPDGNTLFNNNQTRSGIKNTSLTSQWIFSIDDIGFDGNQSECLGGIPIQKTGILAINTVLWAITLRASDSRFKEILEVGQRSSARVSLLTLSILMNNTTNNQGDRCIRAINALNAIAIPPLITDGNQVLDARFCEQFFPPQPD
ncbi:MAG: carboxypeptidase regulatory-like domain-containing protein [Richelia sp. CSU_2_1]|nr:carboxypeptidase regulatory-like domain-containing protein [Microcoleus sp. SU_5_3]NJR25887.1 carboxypeptidase regulatory-like domain-containing protein [Richelia sp. CSU_2_1]